MKKKGEIHFSYDPDSYVDGSWNRDTASGGCFKHQSCEQSAGSECS